MERDWEFFFPQFWPRLFLGLFLSLTLFVTGSVVDLRSRTLTLEFLQHLPHSRDATHCLQLQGDRLWFQSCDSFASGIMQGPRESVWSPGACLPCTSHPTLIQEWNIPGQDSSHSLEMKDTQGWVRPLTSSWSQPGCTVKRAVEICKSCQHLRWSFREQWIPNLHRKKGL